MKTWKHGNLSDLITKCKAFVTIPLNLYTGMSLREVEGIQSFFVGADIFLHYQERQ